MFKKSYTPGEIVQILSPQETRNATPTEKTVAKVCDRITRYMARRRTDIVMVCFYDTRTGKTEKNDIFFDLFIKVKFPVRVENVLEELHNRGFSCKTYTVRIDNSFIVSIPKDS